MNVSSKDPSTNLSGLFQILSQPSRLNILEELGNGEACVCHLEALLGERQAYISQQLMFLKDAGLVDSHRKGRNIYYHLTDESLLNIIHSANAFMGNPQVIRDPNTAVPGCPCPKCNSGIKDCPKSD